MSNYCNNCGKILQEGETCGCIKTDNTQNAQNPQTTSPTSSKQIKWLNPKFVVPIAVFVVILSVVIGTVIGLTPEKTSDDDLIRCAKTLVSEQLKSPGSATYSNETVVERDEYGRALVTLTVDSQNGFGAYLRSNFIAVIKTYNKSDDTFTYDSTNGVQSYTEEFLKDTLIERAKEASDWGKPLESSESE